VNKRLLVVLMLVASALGCGSQSRALVGYQRDPIPNVDVVALPSVETDGSETDFSFRADGDGLLLVYFGYTSCPDVCPTTLSDVRRVLDNLDSGDSGRIDVAMVTVDPEVDTPEVLVGYTRSFVADAHVVRTTDSDQLEKAAEQFGASFDKQGSDVQHTGALYGVDKDGNLLITWPYGVTADDLESDIRYLLDEHIQG